MFSENQFSFSISQLAALPAQSAACNEVKNASFLKDPSLHLSLALNSSLSLKHWIALYNKGKCSVRVADALVAHHVLGSEQIDLLLKHERRVGILSLLGVTAKMSVDQFDRWFTAVYKTKSPAPFRTFTYMRPVLSSELRELAFRRAPAFFQMSSGISAQNLSSVQKLDLIFKKMHRSLHPYTLSSQMDLFFGDKFEIDHALSVIDVASQHPKALWNADTALLVSMLRSVRFSSQEEFEAVLGRLPAVFRRKLGRYLLGNLTVHPSWLSGLKLSDFAPASREVLRSKRRLSFAFSGSKPLYTQLFPSYEELYALVAAPEPSLVLGANAPMPPHVRLHALSSLYALELIVHSQIPDCDRDILGRYFSNLFPPRSGNLSYTRKVLEHASKLKFEGSIDPRFLASVEASHSARMNASVFEDRIYSHTAYLVPKTANVAKEVEMFSRQVGVQLSSWDTVAVLLRTKLSPLQVLQALPGLK